MATGEQLSEKNNGRKNSTVNVSINKNNEHPKKSLQIIFFTDLSK